eukprot:COSAG06_NODE_3980_length_4692_cov_4.531679_1_plen_29_part_10
MGMGMGIGMMNDVCNCCCYGVVDQAQLTK